MLFQFTHKGTWKATIFELGSRLEEEKVIQQVLASVQEALPLGSCDPVDLMVPEVSVADRDAVWRFGRPLSVNSRGVLWDFRAMHPCSCIQHHLYIIALL